MDMEYYAQTKEELAHIHTILLNLLIDFDGICKKHGIRYFLGGGTLLGAVRHQGFIPWDDDIDVMMLRGDYDKFCSIAPEELPEHLFLQTYQTDPHYHGDMAKLRLNHTIYETEFSSCFPEMHNGFFIDVFVHDKTAKTKQGQKIHIFLTRLTRSFVFHKWEDTPMQFYGKHRILCRIASVIKKAISIRKWEKLREYVLRFFNKSSSSYLYDGIGQHLSNGVFPESWMQDVVEVVFEGRSFPAPKEYEKYLEFSYGDYMKIPCEEEKRFHKIKRIEYGPY